MRRLLRLPLALTIVVAFIGTMALLPSGAAASECTDTWIGPSEGNWGAAASWSTAAVPTSADIVCIGPAKTVNVSTGTNEAGIILAEGTLSISGGSLHVSEVPSTIAILRMLGGTLESAGEIFVSKSLFASGGTMQGSGATVIGAEASGKVEGGGLTIAERELENNGALTIEGPKASIVGEAGAAVTNTGTLIVNSEGEGSGLIPGAAAPAPTLANTGILEKTKSESKSLSSTQIGFSIDNEGLVETEVGALELTGGGTSGKAAESYWAALSETLWTAQTKIVFAEQTYQLGDASIAGEVQVISGATIKANQVEGPEGSIWLYNGNVDFVGEHASSLGELGVASGAASLAAGAELSTEYLELTTAYLGKSGVEKLESLPEVTLGAGSTTNVESYDQALGSMQLGQKVVFNATSVIEGGQFTAGDETSLTGPNFFVESGSTFSAGKSTGFHIEEPFVEGGTFELGANSTIDGTYFVQEKGSSTFGAGTHITPSKYVYIYEGPFILGKNSVAAMSEMFFQQGGETTFEEGASLDGGELVFFEEGTSTLESGAEVKAQEVFSEEILLDVGASASVQAQTLYLESGELTGPGSAIADELLWQETEMTGSGLTESLKKGSIVNRTSCGKTCKPIPSYAQLDQRHLVTRGSFSLGVSTLAMENGARIDNYGTFNASSEDTTHGPAQIAVPESSKSAPKFINHGEFNKVSGSGTTFVMAPFESFGSVHQLSGTLLFYDPIGKVPSDLAKLKCHCGDPVEPSTGDFSESQRDLSIGGRGVGLDLVRSYSTAAAVASETLGMFGYGWSSSFSDHLLFAEGGKQVTVVGGDGSTTPFTETGKGTFAAASWSQDALSGSSESGYDFTTPDQTEYAFSGTGRLESVTDRNGNQTTLSYDEAGRLKSITDPAERQIIFAYNGEGLVESAKDPMGRTVKYGYAGKELTSVTLPGEESLNWQFEYDASHRMTSMTDGRGGKTTNEYDKENRVISQTDPAKRTRTFEYAPFHTRVTNKANGAVTDMWFTSNNEPFSITRGYGTADATTQTFSYDEAGHLLSETDGSGHTTTYTYDAAGDRTSITNPDKDETKWEYNGTHDVISETTPNGETTTIKRDANGNPETISRPAPEAKTQTFSFAHASNGDLKSMTDPLERTWSYEYDSHGDRKATIDPEGDKATFAYNEDSELTSSISPRGNEGGTEPSEYTTSVKRDPRGRAEEVVDPLGHVTKLAYDPNGNLKSETDAKGHTTKYTYDPDNELTATEKPNGAVLKTEYDGAGEVVTQTDANEHTTSYVRNILEEPIEIVDPLGRKTSQTFNAAGKLKTVTDPTKRVTTYAYDPANRLEGISYSEEATPDVSFEYDPDGSVTKMVDGSGESTYKYDQLGRLETTTNGHGETIGYAYDLANEPKQIVYPNGKGINQSFDAAGRLKSISDWLGNTTSFAYDANSNLEATSFPAGTGNVDEFSYDPADRMSSVSMKKEAKTLASLSYERDKLGQVEAMSSTGLPGAEKESYEYDENDRLMQAGSGSFGYDAADNLTKAPGMTNTYDAASELEKSTNATYTYDEEGERTKTTPLAGASPAHNLSFGGEGSGAGQFSGPLGIATDAEGHVWVADSGNNRVQEFDGKGEFIRQFGSKGSGNGQFSLPRGIAVDAKGNVWVADTGNNRVQEFNAEGKYLSQFGSEGTGNGQFKKPRGIAVDAKGNLWTIEGGGSPPAEPRVQEFNAEGKYLSKFGSAGTGNGQFKGPEGIATDAEGHVWVADSGNNRVQEFNAEGKYLSQFGSVGTGNGQFKTPSALTVDSEGKLWVTDTANDRVQEFNAEGKYLSQFGSEGTGSGQLKSPRAIATDTKDDLWVADTSNDRVQEWVTVTPPTTYAYDQAGNLTAVKQVKEGEASGIDEAFSYNGAGLIASHTTGGSTSYLAWDENSPLPLVLSDGQNSYIYGPGGLPVEQISSKGVPSYFHHDQLGSTRMLTNSTGEAVATFTYTPYGALEASTGSTTTPLGFAGQYTESRSGLQFLRARFYDPATGQFLTRDPLTMITGQPYSYGLDNPLNTTDPSGEVGVAVATCGATVEVPGVDEATCGAAAAEVAIAGGSLIACALFGCEETISAPHVHTAAEDTQYNEEAHEECPLDSTPEGRPLSKHYRDETGPERNIPGSVVDETIENGELVEDLGDRRVYYDPKNDVTVVESKTTGKIISARRGPP
jgi:RHS repeat-associated protein